MKVASDWHAVLRHAWSIRLILVAGLLDGLSAGLAIDPLLLPIPLAAVALTSVAVNAAAFISRLVAQKELAK